ncbi:hypothetical protein SLEP1_g4915 [Rubroshorea leprosula]|uniref:Bulb-type lectin domain-containing protein n=1 Tax=Rubroshorea leprosula TaxID=152421 RepID=A0AAV5I0R7_9ROSI|nr:hypothetical protein SLEP1_g4915 [Rubroshorea leprosula]
MSFVSVLFFVSISPFIALASVPLSKTFKCVNEGEFDFYKAEYNANYRTVRPFSAPFMLCFYNTIPDAFTLGLLMGFTSTESLSLWVWDANLGNPVREKATLTFGQDGNLVLADSDGGIAWQKNTANKKVSQASNYYQMVTWCSMTPKYAWRDVYGPLEVKFNSERETHNEGYAYDINLEYQSTGSTGTVFLLNRPKYNATLSLLRLWPDGNLRVHTFYQHVMWGAWEETLTLFSRDSMWENECQLPERCGKFGLCEDNQCVACLSPKGVNWLEQRL